MNGFLICLCVLGAEEKYTKAQVELLSELARPYAVDAEYTDVFGRKMSFRTEEGLIDAYAVPHDSKTRWLMEPDYRKFQSIGIRPGHDYSIAQKKMLEQRKPQFVTKIGDKDVTYDGNGHGLGDYTRLTSYKAREIGDPPVPPIEYSLRVYFVPYEGDTYSMTREDYREFIRLGLGQGIIFETASEDQKAFLIAIGIIAMAALAFHKAQKSQSRKNLESYGAVVFTKP
jgi:hypothetical protein